MNRQIERNKKHKTNQTKESLLQSISYKQTLKNATKKCPGDIKPELIKSITTQCPVCKSLEIDFEPPSSESAKIGKRKLRCVNCGHKGYKDDFNDLPDVDRDTLKKILKQFQSTLEADGWTLEMEYDNGESIYVVFTKGISRFVLHDYDLEPDEYMDKKYI